jgi:hypothetical protein
MNNIAIMAAAGSCKPTVLHVGDAIKYNHEFYDNEFSSRFNVVQATETDRESFIEALKTKKFFLRIHFLFLFKHLRTTDTAISQRSSGRISKRVVSWANGTPNLFHYFPHQYAYSPLPARASTGQTSTF